jgi:hypothetical protein
MSFLLLPNQVYQPPVESTGNRTSEIGAPGGVNFGAGALIPDVMVFSPLYNPIHLPSGSFM